MGQTGLGIHFLLCYKCASRVKEDDYDAQKWILQRKVGTKN